MQSPQNPQTPDLPMPEPAQLAKSIAKSLLDNGNTTPEAAKMLREAGLSGSDIVETLREGSPSITPAQIADALWARDGANLHLGETAQALRDGAGLRPGDVAAAMYGSVDIGEVATSLYSSYGLNLSATSTAAALYADPAFDLSPAEVAGELKHLNVSAESIYTALREGCSLSVADTVDAMRNGAEMLPERISDVLREAGVPEADAIAALRDGCGIDEAHARDLVDGPDIGDDIPDFSNPERENLHACDSDSDYDYDPMD